MMSEGKIDDRELELLEKVPWPHHCKVFAEAR